VPISIQVNGEGLVVKPHDVAIAQTFLIDSSDEWLHFEQSSRSYGEFVTQCLLHLVKCFIFSSHF